jgi:hypothetical protein
MRFGNDRLRSCLWLLIAGLACAKSDSAVRGIMASTQSGQTVPSKPTITAVGKNQASVKVEFDTQASSSQSLALIVSGLEKNESYIFRVSDASLDPISSFPFKNDGTETLQLAAVPAGTIQHIQDLAVTQGLAATGIERTYGTVMGQIDPTGTQGSCQSIQRVQLVNSTDGTLSASDAPIYFDDDGNFRTTGLSDRQCSYIILNVPPAQYRIQFLSSTLAIVGQHDVLVSSGGETVFGFDIP